MSSRDSEKEKSPLQQAGEDLFNYAIDREDIKWLMNTLAVGDDVNRTTVDYELHNLKIISVGWSISYFMATGPAKEPLQQIFWRSIQEFAKTLSETTGLMIGQDIDFFQVLKDRLDTYVKALEAQQRAPEPAAVIGPRFAQSCGHPEDLRLQMAGARLFLSVIDRVRQYLDAAALT